MTTVVAYCETRIARWLNNVLALIRFVFDLIGGIGSALGDIGSQYFGRLMRRTAAQTSKAFVRGVFVFLAIGVLGAWQAHKLTAALGPLVLPLLETYVLPVLIQSVVPLIVALVVIARSGTALIMKFAFRPLESGDADPLLNAAQIQREVLPEFIAVVSTSAVFYGILSCCLLIGLAGEGLVFQNVVNFMQRAALERSLIEGLVRATISGGVVAFVACALGIHAANEYSPKTHPMKTLRYKIWESNIISLIICSIIAFAT